MTKRTILLAIATLLCAGPADAKPVTVTTAGATVIVGDQAQQRTIVNALRRDPSTKPIDRELCPAARITITAIREREFAKIAGADRYLASFPTGLFQSSKAGTCRIFLNAGYSRWLSPAQVCNLTLHELGHARRLAHTPAGLMRADEVDHPHTECRWTR